MIKPKRKTLVSLYNPQNQRTLGRGGNSDKRQRAEYPALYPLGETTCGEGPDGPADGWDMFISNQWAMTVSVPSTPTFWANTTTARASSSTPASMAADACTRHRNSVQRPEILHASGSRPRSLRHAQPPLEQAFHYGDLRSQLFHAHGHRGCHRNIGKLVGMPRSGNHDSVSGSVCKTSLVFGIPVVGYRLPDGSYRRTANWNRTSKWPTRPKPS